MTTAAEELEVKREEAAREELDRGLRIERLAASFRPKGQRPYNHVGAYLVVRMAMRTKTRGGIELPDEAKEIPAQGIVVARGEGCQYEVGAQVVFSKHVGASLELPDGTVHHEYRIVSEDECYGSFPAESLSVDATGGDAEAAADVAPGATGA